MKLIDSNLLIYSYQAQYTYLRPLVSDRTNYVSSITHLEVLGFYALTEQERAYFEMTFAVLIRLPVNDEIIDMAIRLRQQYKMKSNDSLIAATGLLYGLELHTRNSADFDRVTGLIIVSYNTIARLPEMNTRSLKTNFRACESTIFSTSFPFVAMSAAVCR